MNMTEVRKHAVLLVREAIQEAENSYFEYNEKSKYNYSYDDWYRLVDGYIIGEIAQLTGKSLYSGVNSDLRIAPQIMSISSEIVLLIGEYRHKMGGNSLEFYRWDIVYESIIGTLERINGGVIKKWANVYRKEKLFLGRHPKHGEIWSDSKLCIHSELVNYDHLHERMEELKEIFKSDSDCENKELCEIIVCDEYKQGNYKK